ncbi:MAG: hypothetical protein AAGI68_05895 [Planctomycetota bacterium]
MNKPPAVVYSVPTAALLVGVGVCLPAAAGPVSNLVADVFVEADTEGVQLPFSPAGESDFQRDSGFLEDAGVVGLSVSSLTDLQTVFAESESTVGFTYDTDDDDTATFLYALGGFAFGTVDTPGNDFGAGGSFASIIETQFTIEQSVFFLFTSALNSVVGGVDVEFELIDESSGDVIDLTEGLAGGFSGGQLEEGSYTSRVEVSGTASTGLSPSAFVDGGFTAALELNRGNIGELSEGILDGFTPGTPSFGLGDGEPETPVSPDEPTASDAPSDSGEPVAAPRVIPTPSALLAGVLGVGVLVCRRRRG